jgi:hypothetical protein
MDEASRFVHELIRPDGTIDLDTGFQGSIDLSGYRMVTDLNGTPRFLPEDAVFTEKGLPDSGLKGTGLSVTESSDMGLSGTSPEFPSTGILSSDNDYWKGGFGLGLNDAVYALAVNDDILYVGGVFTGAAGGIPVNRIARWDGSVWTGIGDLNGHVHAMTVFGSDLYVAGAFSTVDGLTSEPYREMERFRMVGHGWGYEQPGGCASRRWRWPGRHGTLRRRLVHHGRGAAGQSDRKMGRRGLVRSG